LKLQPFDRQRILRRTKAEANVDTTLNYLNMLASKPAPFGVDSTARAPSRGIRLDDVLDHVRFPLEGDNYCALKNVQA
jgi:hypothetical protein